MILGKIYKLFLLLCLFLLSGSHIIAAEGMPQFNTESFYSQLFWLTITFVCLYITTTYFLLPRIRENIRLRKNKIANDLERSESIKIEIEKMITQSNSKIEEARNQVKQMIKRSITRSSTEYKNQIETLKKQLANKHLETEKSLATYRLDIEKDISNSAISLSALILNKLNFKNLSTDEINEILIQSEKDSNA